METDNDNLMMGRRLLLMLPRSLHVEPTAVGAEDKALVVGSEGGPEGTDGVACIN